MTTYSHRRIVLRTAVDSLHKVLNLHMWMIGLLLHVGVEHQRTHVMHPVDGHTFANIKMPRSQSRCQPLPTLATRRLLDRGYLVNVRNRPTSLQHRRSARCQRAETTLDSTGTCVRAASLCTCLPPRLTRLRARQDDADRRNRERGHVPGVCGTGVWLPTTHRLEGLRA